MHSGRPAARQIGKWAIAAEPRELSPRQAQIAALVAEGFTDKEIAARLGISCPTVRTQIERAFHTANVHSRAALAASYAAGRKILLIVGLLAAAATPAAAAGGAQAASAEQAADAMASALQASDFAALEKLISPSGFNWAVEGGQGLRLKSPQEATQFLRAESGGRLHVSVTARPLRPSPVPWGTQAIDSVWRDFGNVPQQSIVLVLQLVSGSWYWAGGYIARSGPAAAAPSTAAGLPSTGTQTLGATPGDQSASVPGGTPSAQTDPSPTPQALDPGTLAAILLLLAASIFLVVRRLRRSAR